MVYPGKQPSVIRNINGAFRLFTPKNNNPVSKANVLSYPVGTY